MNKQSIKRKIEQHGFTYADVDAPNGTVRITAHGPRVPAGDAEDGHRSTVVTAMRDGNELARVKKHNQAAGAAAFMEFVEKYRA